MSSFATPIRSVVGGPTAKVLASGLDIHTVGELLRHYPRRYLERGELTPLHLLPVGESVTVVARVKSLEARRLKNRKGRMVEVVVTDGSSDLLLTFFHDRGVSSRLVPGRRALFAGTVGSFRNRLQLTHPQFELLEGDPDGDSAADQELIASYASALIPVYPATAALPSWRIAKAVDVALHFVGDVADPLPEQLRQQRDLVDLHTALCAVHKPTNAAEAATARERLRYDEALLFQIVLAQRRAAVLALAAKPRLAASDGLLKRFDERLPFALTRGQMEVGETIATDLAHPRPMHRLLQGEVGSGKTVIALRAMLTVIDAGGQAALLAPTEVLAQQHLRSIGQLLGSLADGGRLGSDDRATTIALLTGGQSAAAHRTALLAAASGDAGIVIGTHALLQEQVQFFDLGLIVVDEQHRFGVEQRDVLRAKSAQPPHVLVMTATPIPRTVAMTVFGDLEVSTLRELPGGRRPIVTHVVPAVEQPHFLRRAWERVREEVAAGGQAYVVCPRIGEALEAEPDPAQVAADQPSTSVLELAVHLGQHDLAGLRVEVMHGRLSAEVKDDVMRRFVAGNIDVLVSTTVIEVGVDVANATAMVVMDADRFGVSQLHQLRGRVGRGTKPGLCLLVTRAEATSSARERLDAVAATADGFELARLDLEQRREGDVLGASQAGSRSSLRLLRVTRDENLIEVARADAANLVAADPWLSAHTELAELVKELQEEQRAEYLDKA